MQIISKRKSRIIAAAVALLMVLSCFSFTQESSHAASAKKSPYQKGDNIKNAVFYIAVDADGNGKITDETDVVYYYTYNEIKNAGEEVAYHYGNHGQGETAHVKGAKLSTLLDNLEGVDIQDSWIIQYMEEDAFHATQASYQDTVQGLTDEDGVGNGSGAGIAVETIIGYANKATYDAPDANNVNETTYTPFLNYEREASYVRAYRQTESANSSVLKLLKGVVISNNASENLPTGECGYMLKSVDASGTQIADDYEVKGLLEGMVWPVTPNVDIPWATLNSSQSGNWNGASKLTTIGSDTSAEISFIYTETPFFTLYEDGNVLQLLRSNLAGSGYEFPTTNKIDGTTYEYFGYNKPMYVRYQGVYLDNLMDTPDAGEKVYIVNSNGSKVDITSRVDDFFVAYYYTQSKSSSNISNGKRVPLNYSYSVLVDTKSAPIEYSNDGSDYKVESGKAPTIYENAQVVVTDTPANVSGLTVKLLKYNQVKASWNRVSGAKGYTVYYKAGNGSWKSKNVSGTSITLSNLSKGTSYAVKVKAYKQVGKLTLYSNSYSTTGSAITLKAPALKVKKAKKRASIKIQNIQGESGYQIYQKIGKNKWKRVKTLKANKVTWKSKVLKKNKKYSYKVRAYKTVDGKKIYGPWSSVKKIKR